MSELSPYFTDPIDKIFAMAQAFEAFSVQCCPLIGMEENALRMLCFDLVMDGKLAMVRRDGEPWFGLPGKLKQEVPPVSINQMTDLERAELASASRRCRWPNAVDLRSAKSKEHAIEEGLKR